MEFSIDGKLKDVATGLDPATDKFIAAMFSPSGFVDMMFLTADYLTDATAEGFRFTAQVHQASQDQGLNTALFNDIKLYPYPVKFFLSGSGPCGPSGPNAIGYGEPARVTVTISGSATLHYDYTAFETRNR